MKSFSSPSRCNIYVRVHCTVESANSEEVRERLRDARNISAYDCYNVEINIGPYFSTVECRIEWFITQLLIILCDSLLSLVQTTQPHTSPISK